MDERPSGLWLRFFLLSLGVTAVLAALGYPATVRLAGTDAVSGMVVGCGVSLLASWVGMVPVAMAARSTGGDVATAVLAGTVLRLVVALALALLIVAGGWCDRTALLVWVAVSYMVLLAVDTAYAVRVIHAMRMSRS